MPFNNFQRELLIANHKKISLKITNDIEYFDEEKIMMTLAPSIILIA